MRVECVGCSLILELTYENHPRLECHPPPRRLALPVELPGHVLEPTVGPARKPAPPNEQQYGSLDQASAQPQGLDKHGSRNPIAAGHLQTANNTHSNGACQGHMIRPLRKQRPDVVRTERAIADALNESVQSLHPESGEGDRDPAPVVEPRAPVTFLEWCDLGQRISPTPAMSRTNCGDVLLHAHDESSNRGVLSSTPRLEVREEVEEVIDRHRTVAGAGVGAVVEVGGEVAGFEGGEEVEEIIDGDGAVACAAVGE